MLFWRKGSEGMIIVAQHLLEKINNYKASHEQKSHVNIYRKAPAPALEPQRIVLQVSC